MKIKLKKQRKKALFSQNEEVQKQINEYKKILSYKPSEKTVKFNETVVIYKENRSEIDFLKFSLEEKTKELEELKGKLKENENFYENVIKSQENTTKATIIIKEEAFKQWEVKILKENELIFNNMKDLQEKTLFLQLKLEKTRQKKKNLKEIFNEFSKNEEKNEENLKEFYIKELINQKKSLDLLEEELKGVLAKNCQLEEFLTELQREKEGFLEKFVIEKDEKKLWKAKYEENQRKFREITEENKGFWKILDEFQGKMMKMMKEFCDKSQKTEEKQRIYQFPLQTCHFSHFIEKEPEIRQRCNGNSICCEEM